MSTLEWILTVALVVVGFAALAFGYLFWKMATTVVETINRISRRR